MKTLFIENYSFDLENHFSVIFRQETTVFHVKHFPLRPYFGSGR